MAIIDLMDLQPTSISKDLKDKFIMVYGREKVGKTTFASQIPDSLILAFEKGTNALSGVYVVPIEKWSDAKLILRSLKREDVREKYGTIAIDTVGIAWNLCEQYICNQNGVKSLSEMPWGSGWAAAKKEFAEFLRQITMYGYGLVLIAHEKITAEPGPNETVIEHVAPNIPNPVKEIVNALVDLTAYIDLTFDEEGRSSRTLITRRSPTVMAGSRWKYLAEKIKFGYQELVDAIGEAIEKQERLDGARVTNETEKIEVLKDRPFSEAMEEARELWKEKVGENLDIALKVHRLIEEIFGYETKISEMKEQDLPLLEVLIEEMRNL